jgi:hypothetical protein
MIFLYKVNNVVIFNLKISTFKIFSCFFQIICIYKRYILLQPILLNFKNQGLVLLSSNVNLDEKFCF